MSKDIFQLKIVATDAGNKIERMPYRTIQFHKDTTLMQLAQHILKAFSFKMSEPFGFYSNPDDWNLSEHKYELFEDDPKKESLKNTFVDEIFELQKEFLLIYDYLEEHRFLIIYEKMIPVRSSVQYPDVIESMGETKSTNETILKDDDDDDEPRFGAKKKTGGIKDEYDDLDDDDLRNKNDFDDEDDEDGELDAGDEFGFDEFGGGKSGYED